MALDATEGEQKLKHTASNREHVWRLLQGGELIAPVPPLPPRGTPLTPLPPPVESVTSREEDHSQPPPSGAAIGPAPAPPVKKTRSRKKVEAPPPDLEQGTVIQTDSGDPKAVDPPRRRRKKTETTVVEDPQQRINVPSSLKEEASSRLIDAKEA